MAQQYASGETMRLTVKLTPAATSMTGNKDVGTTSGRFFLSNNNQVEWISFTGKTANGDGTYTYTGLTRGLSQTADPVTGGTGSTWLANQECILVAMHDQLVDKTQATTFASTITFADDINFSGTTKGGLTLKSLTQAQINALTPVVGYKVFNTDTGTVQTYYSGTWNNEGTSTTPNASTTVAGKVEVATQAEVNAGTDTGGTGATVVVIPSTLANSTTIPNIHGATQKQTPVSLDELIISDSAASFANKKLLMSDVKLFANGIYYGHGGDGDVTISTTVTLIRDMFYNNLTVSTGAILNPAGFKIYVRGTFSMTGGTIQNNASDSTGGIGGTNGGAGGSGATTTGNPGTASSNVTNTAITVNNGSGNGALGGSANGPSGDIGAAGTNTAYPYISNTWQEQINGKIFLSLATSVESLVSTSAGGGGAQAGGSSGLQGRAGGAGGGSGGKMFIIAQIVSITGGTISLVGGIGTAGATATTTNEGGGGGGGGGGSGGVLLLFCDTITNSGTITLAGGAGGNGGNATTFQGGSGGNGGMGGRIYLLVAKSGSIGSPVLTGGAGGSLGTGSSNGTNGVAGTTGTVISITY